MRIKMTDMSKWTEDEIQEYLKVLRRATMHEKITIDEIKLMSSNTKNALMEMYSELLYPKQKWYDPLLNLIRRK